MGIYHCTGEYDQIFQLCDDGSIRNLENNYCLTNALIEDGSEKIISASCMFHGDEPFLDQ